MRLTQHTLKFHLTYSFVLHYSYTANSLLERKYPYLKKEKVILSCLLNLNDTLFV